MFSVSRYWDSHRFHHDIREPSHFLNLKEISGSPKSRCPQKDSWEKKGPKRGMREKIQATAKLLQAHERFCALHVCLCTMHPVDRYNSWLQRINWLTMATTKKALHKQAVKETKASRKAQEQQSNAYSTELKDQKPELGSAPKMKLPQFWRSRWRWWSGPQTLK